MKRYGGAYLCVNAGKKCGHHDDRFQLDAGRMQFRWRFEERSAPEGTENVVHTTGFPIVDQTVDLKMFTRIAPVNGPFKEMPVFQDYEKLSNVKVEFIEAPTDGFQEKKTCCSPPMSQPDALFRSGLSPLEAVRYGSAGQLIPLEGLIDEYAPNLKN